MLYLRYQKFSHRCMLGVGGSNYVHLRDMYKYLHYISCIYQGVYQNVVNDSVH